MLQIVKRLMGKSDDDSQVLAMKMAANLGDSDLSDVIEPKIRDRSASVLQRMEAVTSLQKMAMDDSEKVSRFYNDMKAVFDPLWYGARVKRAIFKGNKKLSSMTTGYYLHVYTFINRSRRFYCLCYWTDQKQKRCGQQHTLPSSLQSRLQQVCSV